MNLHFELEDGQEVNLPDSLSADQTMKVMDKLKINQDGSVQNLGTALFETAKQALKGKQLDAEDLCQEDLTTIAKEYFDQINKFQP